MHSNDQTRNKLAFVSTDGHRLTLVQTKHATAEHEISCILPTVSVRALLAALDEKSDSPVIIQWGMTRATFAGESFRIASKIIDGSFPDYTRVIPRSDAVSLQLDSKTIKKQVSRMVKLGAQSVRLEPQAGIMEALNAEGNKFSFKHDFKPSGLDCESFGVNAKYLLDLIDVGACRIEAGENITGPIALFPESNGPFDDVRFVLMPLRK